MHFEHGSRCAICGDGYEEEDRPHEVPGKYATGIIGRSYFIPGQVYSSNHRMGNYLKSINCLFSFHPRQTIEVIIDMVANHGGFFQFNLCVNNNPYADPDQSCFREHPLRFSDGELQHHTVLDHRLSEQSRIYLEACSLSFFCEFETKKN